MKFPEMIKMRLAEIGMSQTALADQLGTSRQNFSNKMSRDSFSMEEVAKICHALDLTIVLKHAGGEYIIDYEE